MKLCLTEDKESNTMQRASLLHLKGIIVSVENNVLKFNTLGDFIKALIHLRSNNLMSNDEFDYYFQEICQNRLKRSGVDSFLRVLRSLRVDHMISKDQLKENIEHIYATVYQYQTMIKLEQEDYYYGIYQDQTIIHNDQKYLSISKALGDDEVRLYVSASDGNSDNEAMDSRKISFMIRENSPLYSIIDSSYSMGNREFLPDSYNMKDNHLSIEKNNEGNYILSVVKIKKDRQLSNEEFAIVDVGGRKFNDSSFDFVSSIDQAIRQYYHSENKNKKM